jgi:hypothetical protein
MFFSMWRIIWKSLAIAGGWLKTVVCHGEQGMATKLQIAWKMLN